MRFNNYRKSPYEDDAKAGVIFSENSPAYGQICPKCKHALELNDVVSHSRNREGMRQIEGLKENNKQNWVFWHKDCSKPKDKNVSPTVYSLPDWFYKVQFQENPEAYNLEKFPNTYPEPVEVETISHFESFKKKYPQANYKSFWDELYSYWKTGQKIAAVNRVRAYSGYSLELSGFVISEYFAELDAAKDEEINPNLNPNQPQKIQVSVDRETKAKVDKLGQFVEQHNQQITNLGQSVLNTNKIAEEAKEIASTANNAVAATAERVAQVLEDNRELVADIKRLKDARPVVFVIKSKDKDDKHINAGMVHKNFGRLVKTIQNLAPDRRNIWIHGEAGTGKSHAAKQLTQIFTYDDGKTLPYYHIGSIDQAYKLRGYNAPNIATGEQIYFETGYYRWFKYGGIFLADELDNSATEAVVEINADLANGYASFPKMDKKNQTEIVFRHKNAIFCGSANSLGEGGSGQYLRNKLDKAFLNRFKFVPWPHDDNLEYQIVSGMLPTDPTSFEYVWAMKWLDAVKETRNKISTAGAAKGGMFVGMRSVVRGTEGIIGEEPSEWIIEGEFSNEKNHNLFNTVFAPIIEWGKQYDEATNNKNKESETIETEEKVA